MDCSSDEDTQTDTEYDDEEEEVSSFMESVRDYLYTHFDIPVLDNIDVRAILKFNEY